MHRTTCSLLGVIACVVLSLVPPASAQVSPLGAHPIEASRAISRLIAARNAEASTDLAARLMGGPSGRDKLLPIMTQATELGPNNYVDRVYERAFGTSSYDIIDRLNFEKAVIFVRYLFSVERNQWTLVNFTFKSELSLPLPREWVHIYPDGLVGPGSP